MKFGKIEIKAFEDENFPLWDGSVACQGEESEPSMLEIDIEKGKVLLRGGSVVPSGYHDGIPEAVYNNRIVQIESKLNWLKKDEIESLCEEISGDVDQFLENASIEWNGSNNVGKFDESIVDSIQEKMDSWESVSEDNEFDEAQIRADEDYADFSDEVEELTLEEISKAAGFENEKEFKERIEYVMEEEEVSREDAIQKILEEGNVMEGLDDIVGCFMKSAIEVSGDEDFVCEVKQRVLELL